MSDTSAETCRALVKKLGGEFARNHHELWTKDVRDWTRADAIEVLKYLRETWVNKKGGNGNGLVNVFSHFKKVFNYLIRAGILDKSPAVGIAVKGIRPLPEFFTEDEVKRILDTDIEYNNQLIKARDQAIFEVMYSCGLRAAETTRLTVEDLDTICDDGIVYDKKNFFCQPSLLNLDLKPEVIQAIRENFRKIS